MNSNDARSALSTCARTDTEKVTCNPLPKTRKLLSRLPVQRSTGTTTALTAAPGTSKSLVGDKINVDGPCNSQAPLPEQALSIRTDRPTTLSSASHDVTTLFADLARRSPPPKPTLTLLSVEGEETAGKSLGTPNEPASITAPRPPLASVDSSFHTPIPLSSDYMRAD